MGSAVVFLQDKSLTLNIVRSLKGDGMASSPAALLCWGMCRPCWRCPWSRERTVRSLTAWWSESVMLASPPVDFLGEAPGVRVKKENGTARTPIVSCGEGVWACCGLGGWLASQVGLGHLKTSGLEGGLSIVGDGRHMGKVKVAWAAH